MHILRTLQFISAAVILDSSLINSMPSAAICLIKRPFSGLSPCSLFHSHYCSVHHQSLFSVPQPLLQCAPPVLVLCSTTITAVCTTSPCSLFHSHYCSVHHQSLFSVPQPLLQCAPPAVLCREPLFVRNPAVCGWIRTNQRLASTADGNFVTIL